jgi:hypothetical protein
MILCDSLAHRDISQLVTGARRVAPDTLEQGLKRHMRTRMVASSACRRREDRAIASVLDDYPVALSPRPADRGGLIAAYPSAKLCGPAISPVGCSRLLDGLRLLGLIFEFVGFAFEVISEFEEQ